MYLYTNIFDDNQRLKEGWVHVIRSTFHSDFLTHRSPLFPGSLLSLSLLLLLSFLLFPSRLSCSSFFSVVRSVPFFEADVIVLFHSEKRARASFLFCIVAVLFLFLNTEPFSVAIEKVTIEADESSPNSNPKPEKDDEHSVERPRGAIGRCCQTSKRVGRTILKRKCVPCHQCEIGGASGAKRTRNNQIVVVPISLQVLLARANRAARHAFRNQNNFACEPFDGTSREVRASSRTEVQVGVDLLEPVRIGAPSPLVSSLSTRPATASSC